MRFDDVVKAYDSEKKSYSREEDLKCKQQYLYALSNLQVLNNSRASVAEVAPVSNFQSSPDNPVYIKEVKPPLSFWGQVLLVSKYAAELLMIGLLGFILFMSYKAPAGGLLDKNKHILVAETSNVRFEDVRGINECRSEIEELVEYLKEPEKYHKLGAKLPKGILLTGNPGTGKTLLAKAIAGEAGVKFFYNSGSDFEEIFVGLGAKRVRELFQEAKKNAPCIIFIDEIDAIGSSRKSRDMNYNRQSLNQLLVEMDGFESRDNIIVIGATNFADSLDHALVRAGRFDKRIDIPNPDIKGRTEILELYLSRVYVDPSVNKEEVARGTVGLTGADLANLVNIAMLHAIKNGRSAMTWHDIEFAKDRIYLGVQRGSLAMTAHDKHLTAIHEAGHALAAHFNKNAHPVHKITILPRGSALGVTHMLPIRDKVSITREEILAQVDVSMGGRVAEELIFGKDKLTSGCESDMQSATSMLYNHVAGGIFNEYTGPINIRSLDERQLPPKTSELVIDTVNKLMNQSYERTFAFLKSKQRVLEMVAKELVERETLDRKEFLSIVEQYS
jgi:ATP-dependent metalloprotease